jgi:hypothetical protein
MNKELDAVKAVNENLKTAIESMRKLACIVT